MFIDVCVVECAFSCFSVCSKNSRGLTGYALRLRKIRTVKRKCSVQISYVIHHAVPCSVPSSFNLSCHSCVAIGILAQ